MSNTNVISVLPGTGPAALGKVTGGAATAADVGMTALAVRDDAPTTLTVADGDYTQLRVSSTGALHVTGGDGVVTNAGTFAVQVDGDALTALQSIATATSGSAGTEGNLFDAVSVVAVNTSSATVDTTALGRVTILVTGSDLLVTTAFDVWVSGNGGVAWYFSSQIYLSSTDGAGNPLASRFGSLSLDVSGVNMVKLIAHGTETVTASLYGR